VVRGRTAPSILALAHLYYSGYLSARTSHEFQSSSDTKEHSLLARTSRDLALHFGLDTHHLRVRVRVVIKTTVPVDKPDTPMRTWLHSLSWATTDDDDCLAFCD